MKLTLLTLLTLTASTKDLPKDTHARVRRLEQIVTEKAARDAGRQFPEGELFTYEFFGLALANIAESSRASADIEKAVTKGEWLLKRIDECLEHPPFARNQNLPATGGIIWLGGRNLLLARLIRLAPQRWSQEHVERFHQDSRTLHQVFMSEPSGVPETFAGKRWPVDGLFALESLRIHDQLFGTRLVSVPLEHFLKTMRRGADSATGLMPSHVNAAGDSSDVPRGCAMSWSLAVLPNLAPTFAAAQWSLYKKHFLTEGLGFLGFREYPRGVDRKGDIDSGPVIAGVGLSASAFGMAAARANGDIELAAKLERIGDTLRLFVGEIVFFEVMTLWVKTIPISRS